MKLKHKLAIDLLFGNLLIFILKPLAIVLGYLLKRDHKLILKKNIFFLKMLGGGSLVIAFPAILGLKLKNKDLNFCLITTKDLKPFAEVLGVFDEIFLIDDSTIIKLFTTGFKTLLRCFKADTFVDLEVYSALSAVFSLFTLARNRIGYYTQNVFFKKNIHSHLIYFNPFSGSYLFYDEIPRLFNISPASFEECSKFIMNSMNITKVKTDKVRIAIGHGCSNLSKERMLSKEQWIKIFSLHLGGTGEYEINFLGVPEDKLLADEIIAVLKSNHPHAVMKNHCGKTNLHDSLKILSDCTEFWGIDSALLHYARLFGLNIMCFFGPTMPEILLKPFSNINEKIFYKRIPCSPCVHVTMQPPCNGNNICMKNLLDNSSDNSQINLLYYFPKKQ